MAQRTQSARPGPAADRTANRAWLNRMAPAPKEPPPTTSGLTRRAAPRPSLAELRRRATQRLRDLAMSVACARADYLAAARECARLRAAGLPQGRPREASGERVRDPSAGTPPDPARRVGEPLATAPQNELHEKLRAAEAALSQEREANKVLAGRTQVLEARIDELKEALCDGARGATRKGETELTALEAELRRAQAANARLQEDLSRLLGFLEELSDILPGSAEVAPAALQGAAGRGPGDRR